MELFQKARTVRLRSYLDKYLTALDDQVTVVQDRDRSTMNAIWAIEFVPEKDALRFVSCYGKNLTASNVPFVSKSITGRKVLQTTPASSGDPRIEWEPLRDGFQVKLKSTVWGHYLRPNGGVPPWRNTIRHDIPHRNTTYNKILWDVEVVESREVALPARDHRRAQSDYTFDRSKSCSAASPFLSRTPNVTCSARDFVDFNC